MIKQVYLRFTAAIMIIASVLAIQPVMAEGGKQSSHHQAAVELIEAMNTRELFDGMMKQMDQMIMQQLSGLMGDDTTKYKSAIDGYSKAVADIFNGSMNYDELQNVIAQSYVAVYSEQEMREVTAFYRTPVGQKFVSKAPELMQQTMAITQTKMQQVMPQIMQAAQKLAAEIQEINKQ